MSVSTDPNVLAESAKCLKCLSGSTLIEAQTYLLAIIAGVDPDPNALAQAARSFKTLPRETLLEVQTYLLCQIVNSP